MDCLKLDYFNKENPFTDLTRRYLLDSEIERDYKIDPTQNKQYHYYQQQLTPYWIKNKLSEGHVMTINIHLSSTLKILVQGTAVNKNDCKSDTTNHSITLVGYEPGYWIVLNSWVKNRILKDHTFFKIPWWKNFAMNEDGTKCFCGGAGSDCEALMFVHENLRNKNENREAAR